MDDYIADQIRDAGRGHLIDPPSVLTADEFDALTREPRQVDLVVRAEGLLFLFTPKTPAGREFLTENAPEDAQWFGPSLVIEHRYAIEWVGHAVGVGLSVE